MATVTLYRYEHPDSGMGPYTHEWDGTDEINYAHNSDDSHPGFKWEGEPKYIALWELNHSYNECKNLYCALETEAKVKAWFKGWNTRIIKAGFVLKEYKVDKAKVIFGRSQVGFFKE